MTAIRKSDLETIRALIEAGASDAEIMGTYADDHEAYCDGMDAAERDDSDWAFERRSDRCTNDDTMDSKGRSLRPARNEAGEPWWM